MRAYHVTDGDDYSDVVFAETPGKAKLLTDWWCEVPFISLRVRRAAAFDDVDGRITQRHYLERGWRTSCYWCDAVLDNEDDASEYHPASKAVFDGMDNAFCSDECRDNHPGSTWHLPKHGD